MAKQSHEKSVVIETFRWSRNAVPEADGSDDDSSDLAVLLSGAATAPRRRVDLVVVPNLGVPRRSRDEPAGGVQLGRMIREAMASMVKCLRQDDRLCWKGDGGRYEGLVEKASCSNIEKMIDNTLTVAQITLGIELEAACEVLENRSPEESKCRLGLIVLLSVGRWVVLGEPTSLPTAYQSKRSGSKFPVYGILLTDHDEAMVDIAGGNNGSGGGAHVCYVPDQDMEIPDMSPPAVRIDMVTFGGVAVSSAMTMSGGGSDEGDGADEDGGGGDDDDVYERLLQGRRRRGHHGHQRRQRRRRRRSD